MNETTLTIGILSGIACTFAAIAAWAVSSRYALKLSLECSREGGRYLLESLRKEQEKKRVSLYESEENQEDPLNISRILDEHRGHIYYSAPQGAHMIYHNQRIKDLFDALYKEFREKKGNQE